VQWGEEKEKFIRCMDIELNGNKSEVSLAEHQLLNVLCKVRYNYRFRKIGQ